MNYLIYRKSDGSIDSMRSAPGVDTPDGALEQAFGPAHADFGAIHHDGGFPIGAMVDGVTLTLVRDPGFITPVHYTLDERAWTLGIDPNDPPVAAVDPDAAPSAPKAP